MSRSRPMQLAAGIVICLGVILVAAPATADLLGPEMEIASLDCDQQHLAVAYAEGHDEYLVVWENQWPGNRDIYARRVSGDGQPLAPWFAVTYGAGDRVSPAVAYDRTRDRYLVTWSFDVFANDTDWDLVGRFIPRTGPDPLELEFSVCAWSSDQTEPALAFGLAQDEFLVVWTESGGLGVDIGARRIPGAGASPALPPFVISDGPLDRSRPDVAYNLARNEYLLVWEDDFPPGIQGMRLRGDATTLGGGAFLISAYNPHVDSEPSVAACDRADTYVVTWNSSAASGSSFTVRPYAGDGTVVVSAFIVDTGPIDPHPEISCLDAHGTFVITSLYRSGLLDAIMDFAFDATVSSPIVNVSILATNADGGSVGRPAAAATGAGSVLAVWQRGRTTAPVWEDVYGRTLTVILVFGDGFETGDTSAWNATQP